jgi:hypothetical protein
VSAAALANGSHAASIAVPGVADGSVLTLDNGAPAWHPASAGVPDGTANRQHLEWDGTAWVATDNLVVSGSLEVSGATSLGSSHAGSIVETWADLAVKKGLILPTRPGTLEDGMIWWESGEVRAYLNSSEVVVGPSPVPLPHSAAPVYKSGSYGNRFATIENGKLLINQSDVNGNNWADAFLSIPVGTVITWTPASTNLPQEHIVTGPPTLGPTMVAGEPVIEVPVAGSTALVSGGDPGGTFSWPGGPPDTGNVLTATPTGMAWLPGGSGPEVAVGPTEPTDPSVLLWVKTPGA